MSTYGYNGKILRVNLSDGSSSVEEPGENFYRKYIGGRGFVSYYLLNELNPGIDPLSPENKLIFAAGVVTGHPVGGCGRNSVGAKSPLTCAYGDAEVGGFWGAELKHAGFDAIIIEGKAEKPVYLLIKDSKFEVRDASHLWGKTTGECQQIIKQELGDKDIRVAQIGPAGEKLVRYACILNDLHHAAGRCGLGAVMGSKNLKAIAIRGTNPPAAANPAQVKELAKWIHDSVESTVKAFYDQGTAGGLWVLNRSGGLPTRNFQEGVFAGADKISGRVLRDTILVARRSCFACPVHCKREVALNEPYKVDPMYGGPEYETLASLGSNCGIDNLAAISKGSEWCNANGLDTISAGVCISFAMECFERGILTTKDTDGIDLHFGNAESMLKLLQMITCRQGLGDLLANGVATAAMRIGKGSEEFAMHVKGQEIPMHEPRFKQGMGLGYAISPTGADHCHNIHDSLYTAPGPYMEEIKSLGLLNPLPAQNLGSEKVRMVNYFLQWRYLQNSLVFCQFVPLSPQQINELVGAVTGWNTTLWELMKVGERSINMTRVFNIREGWTGEFDKLPKRFFTPFSSGPLSGVAISQDQLEKARELYYKMAGWETPGGKPTVQKLQELDIEWATAKL